MTTFANFSMDLLRQNERVTLNLMKQTEESASKLMEQSAKTVSELSEKYLQASSGILTQQAKLFEMLCSNMTSGVERSHQASLPSPRRPRITTQFSSSSSSTVELAPPKKKSFSASSSSSSTSCVNQPLYTEKDANVLRQIAPIKRKIISLLLGEYLSDAPYPMIIPDMFFYLHKFGKIGAEPISIDEPACKKKDFVKSFYRNVYYHHTLLTGGRSDSSPFNMMATEKYGDSSDKLCDAPMMFLNIIWFKQLMRDVANRTSTEKCSPDEEDIFFPVENFHAGLRSLVSQGTGFADHVDCSIEQEDCPTEQEVTIDQLFRDLLDASKTTGFISRARSKQLNTVTDGNMKNILFKLMLVNPSSSKFSLKHWQECYKQLMMDLFVCGFNYSASKSKGHLGELTKVNDDLTLSEVSDKMSDSFFALVTEYLRGPVANGTSLMGIARRKMTQVSFTIDNVITVCCHPTYRNPETVNLDYDYTVPKKVQTLLPPLYALPPGLVVCLKPMSHSSDGEDEEDTIVESSDEKEEEDDAEGGGGDTYRFASVEAKLESGMAWRDYGPILSLPAYQKATVLEMLKKINEKVPPTFGEHMSFVRRVALMVDIQRIHFWITYLNNYVSNLPTECNIITDAHDVALLNNLLSICDIMVKTVESAVDQWNVVQSRDASIDGPHCIIEEVDIKAFFEIGHLGIFNLEAPLTEESSTDIAVLCKLINDSDDEVCVTMKASDPFRILRRGKGGHSSADPKYSVLQYCIYVLLNLYNDFKSVFIDIFTEFRAKITEFIQSHPGGEQLLGGGSGSKRKRFDGDGNEVDKRPRITVDD